MRRMSQAIQVQNVRQLHHLDYIYMKFAYLLVTTDYCSRKVELVHYESTTMENSANGTISWKSRCGLRQDIVYVRNLQSKQY